MMMDDLAELSFLERLDPSNTEGLTAQAGTRLPAGAKVASRDEVIEALRRVHDPEIPVNVYDLGLIYDLRIDSTGDVTITMTLTAPSCPVAGEIPRMIAEAATGAPGIGITTVTLTWEPKWTTAMMSEDARLALGLDG